MKKAFISLLLTVCAIVAQGQYIQSLLKKVDSLNRTGNYKQAIDLINFNDYLLRKEDNLGNIYYKLSQYYFSIKEYRLSEQMSLKALREGGLFAEFDIAYAHALLLQGKTDEAGWVYRGLLNDHRYDYKSYQFLDRRRYADSILKDFARFEIEKKIPSVCWDDFKKIKADVNSIKEEKKICEQFERLSTRDESEAFEFIEPYINKLPKYYVTIISERMMHMRGGGNDSIVEKYLLKAKNIYETILGKTNASYAILLNRLGDLYIKKLDYSNGKKYLLEAINIQEKVLKKDHPEHINLLIDLGVLFSKMEDEVQAEAYFKEAAEIRDQGQTSDSVRMKHYRLCNEKKYSEAIILLRTNENIFQKENNLAEMFSLLSWDYLFTKEYNLAEQMALKALELTHIWDEKLKPLLAHALLLQGKTDEARKLYKESIYTLGTYLNVDSYVNDLLRDLVQFEQEIIPPDRRSNVEEAKRSIDSIRKEMEVYKQFENLPQFESSYDSLLLLVETNSNSIPGRYKGRVADIVLYKADSLGNAKKYLEAIALIRKYQDVMPNEFSSLKVYSVLGKYYLFAKDFRLAEEMSLKALGTTNTDKLDKTNLAHALLFQGKMSQAEIKYRELMDTPDKDGAYDYDYDIFMDHGYSVTNPVRIISLPKEYENYAVSLLKDFEQFEKEHIVPANRKNDFERMKAVFYNAIDDTKVWKQFKHLYDSRKYDEAFKLISLYTDKLPKQYVVVVADMMRGSLQEKYIFEAKNIYEKIFGKNNWKYAHCVYDLGKTYSSLGYFAKSEEYYLEAKDLFKKLYGKEHQNYLATTYDLAALYQEMGDYKRAIKYYQEANDIAKNQNVYNNYEYANSVNNLGWLYYKMGDYEKAEKYLLEAKKNASNLATSLNNLGDTYIALGDYPQAKSCFLDAIDNFKNVIAGERNPAYASSFYKLGALYSINGDFEKSESYFLDAKYLFKKFGNEKHPDYSGFLNMLSLLYGAMGKSAKAIDLNKELSDLTKYDIGNNFSFLSDQQRSFYWETRNGYLTGAYSLASFSYSSELNSLNYNNTLFTKGLLLRTTNGIRDGIYASGNKELISKYEQLGSLRKLIYEQQTHPEYKKEKIDSLQLCAENLDKSLTQTSTTFRDIKADMAMTWQNVQKQLKPSEAAIEFVSFRLYDKKWTDRTIYAALIVRPGMSNPRWVPLCEQKDLQAAMQTTDQDTTQQLQIENLYSGNNHQLYRLVWQALEKELSAVKTVYYSPAGLLYKIAFNALPTGREGELLSDKYNLQLVSSTREIVRLKKEPAALSDKDTIAVYGGLTYDLQQQALAAFRPGKQVPEQGKRFDISRFRRAYTKQSDTKSRGGFSEWVYLPGTAAEAQQIVSYLNLKHAQYKYYTTNQGSEESFKQLSGTQTSVIHLATHGFFLPDVENKVVEDIVQRLGGAGENASESPLLRSGLVLSGANRQWLTKQFDAADIGEDGILTADEISRLNLTKTRLVVLSACETGLGDVKNSEGVFGLQRAFKLAGVESLIMSLWKVPDEATAELMTTFYQQWLAGESKQSAFKTARQKVREKYKSPYYWAAFVMMD